MLEPFRGGVQAAYRPGRQPAGVVEYKNHFTGQTPADLGRTKANRLVAGRQQACRFFERQLFYRIDFDHRWLANPCGERGGCFGGARMECGLNYSQFVRCQLISASVGQLAISSASKDCDELVAMSMMVATSSIKETVPSPIMLAPESPRMLMKLSESDLTTMS